MGQGIQRKPAFPLRRVVAKPRRRPGVREFVRRRQKPEKAHVYECGFQVHADRRKVSAHTTRSPRTSKTAQCTMTPLYSESVRALRGRRPDMSGIGVLELFPGYSMTARVEGLRQSIADAKVYSVLTTANQEY